MITTVFGSNLIRLRVQHLEIVPTHSSAAANVKKRFNNSVLGLRSIETQGNLVYFKNRLNEVALNKRRSCCVRATCTWCASQFGLGSATASFWL
jgi:hypothetical protein